MASDGSKDDKDKKKEKEKEPKLSVEEKLAQAELLKAMYGLNMRKPTAPAKNHQFWNTQPVPQLDENPSDCGPIEVKTLDEVRKDPLPLPGQFEWSDCDIADEKVLDEVYTLLYTNYVEDDDNMFRFDYSRDFLKWALCPPGFLPQLHIGVRVKGTGKLVGFITGIPAKIRVYEDPVEMVEINFLCVHKKLRAKRLAPVLIKEITRRVNLTGVWQAVYTAGVLLPKPVARNRYYHRSLNPKKLIDIGFSRLQRNMTLNRTIKLYKLPGSAQTPGFREITTADIPEAHQLLNEYMRKFKLVQVFSQDEF
jgi:glycylpeptide N-tetradecanoyltransferase